jgi:hypothetical protein
VAAGAPPGRFADAPRTRVLTCPLRGREKRGRHDRGGLGGCDAGCGVAQGFARSCSTLTSFVNVFVAGS